MRKLFLAFACLGLMVSCSTKKDTFKNRVFHGSTAWFNTLFNANEIMDKEINNLEIEYQDNYSEILPVDPRAEIGKDGMSFQDTQNEAGRLGAGVRNPGGNQSQAQQTEGFELAEKKALKAIERHSMMINGKERNKTMTLAYLILGKSRYFQGKGFEALEALNYVQNNLPYHKKYTPEASLFTAMAYYQTGNIFDGERILVTLYKNDGFKKKFKEKVSKYYAENLIRAGKYEEAIDVLDKTISYTKNKKRKARYYFIEGQLYSLLDDQDNAGEAFSRVFKMKPGFEMEVKSQLAIADNFDPEINNYNSYKSHLLKVAKNGNYLSRENEFFFAIGDMAIKAGETDDARKYLQESFKGPASDPYVRGRAYERYADLEFDEGNYVHASAYYDSALSVAPYNKDIERITKRSTFLSMLMEKYYLVKKNDSILMIAHMSETEQKEFFGSYIANLKIEDEKQKKKMEEEATVFQGDMKGVGFGSSFGEGSSSTFYFYNNSVKSNGKMEFDRVWGKIRLADNWRSSSAGGMTLEEKEAELLGQGEAQNPRRYELDYYLEQIPTAPDELRTLKVQRDTAELSLGIGYYDLFNNAKTASSTLEHLISTPPLNEATEAQAMYQLYRIYNKEENTAKADEYKNLILDKYPMSIYAEYILNPEVDYITPTTREAIAFYEETYYLYKEEKYEEVKANMNTALENYPTEIIIAKFSLLNALAIGKTEEREDFISALELITIAYQNTEEAAKAQEILDLLNNTKKGSSKAEEEDAENQKLQKEKERINPAGPTKEEMDLKEREMKRQGIERERNQGQSQRKESAPTQQKRDKSLR